MLCFVIFDIEEIPQYVDSSESLIEESLTLSYRLDTLIELENSIQDILILG